MVARIGNRLGGTVAVALGALVLAGTASAQISVGGAPLKPQNAATGSIPPANQPAHSGPVPRAMVQAPPPAPATPAPPWSGEDGASGHPLMTASAIREAAANFETCVAGMWPDAARRNITRANFERFTAGLTPDLRIMDLMDSQPEFTKSIWDYLDILVNDTRMAKGREVLAKYKPQFDAVEKLYGVDRYIIASIWGVESNYSTQMGDRSVLQSTATLGLHRPPPEIFQGRVSLRAGNPQPRRPAPRADARLMGRRVRPDPIHADRVQALRGGRRRRRPPRRGRRCRRPDRLDRQQPEERRLAERPDLGFRGRAAEGF